MPRVSILLAAIPVCLRLPALAASHPTDAADVLRDAVTFRGRVVSVRGFVRFDRLSRRGFLYRDISDMRRRAYRRTLFLELGNERYASLRIPDGSFIVASGFVSPDLRGPLGVYPAHMIVDRIVVLRRATGRQRPNQAMQLTASKPAVYAFGVCRREFILRGMHRGLAAADLLSR